MKNKIINIGLVLMLLFVSATSLSAHCQIPCGIYDDEHRFVELYEHITTLEKAITQLTTNKALSDNQRIRWTLNKEQHADAFTSILHDYFLTQRIKPVVKKLSKKQKQRYHDMLIGVHELTVLSMKIKQQVTLSTTDQLRQTLKQFQQTYQER